MRRILAAFLPLAALLAVGCSTHHVSTTANGKTVYGEQAQVIERLRDSGTDLKQLMNAPDSSIPQNVLADAKCIAVIPDMVKGGFVIGGNHGRGVATCRLPNGSWSQPAFLAITGGSWAHRSDLRQWIWSWCFSAMPERKSCSLHSSSLAPMPVLLPALWAVQPRPAQTGR